ncbi:nuclear pore complex protein Nup107-like [Varroa jacobsoni]|uniref:nuclear pore complex protein Nup107-like n=1 Tax=Varroa jacobsoni TaxID=62625 RepID=UPI000BF3CCDE|nr:nuclear pore complex protein Nup107-like [Varroa jacobsoni]
MAIRSRNKDRSTYPALFESSTVSRAGSSTVDPFDNYATSSQLPWSPDQNIRSQRGQTITRLPPLSYDAHLKFSEAQYSFGRNETFLVDPEPLVKRYVALAEKFEKQFKTFVADTPVDTGETRDLADFFRNEKFTWMLILALLAASQGEDSSIDLEASVELRLLTSDAEEIEALFETSFDLRKTQSLIDWLEHRYCEEKCVSNLASLHFYKEHGIMYEYTKRAILRDHAHDGIVTELDPDAPMRQQRTLHEQDVEDGQRLFRCVFELVRAGKLSDAQKLAVSQGHFMLAAGMQGWKAFRDNIRDSEGNPLPDEGNPYRDLWKIVVWKKLADDRVDPAEKAIYGALSGCLEALLLLCTTWEDHLWAHLKVMIDVAIELYFRNSRCADIGRLPDAYPKEIERLDVVIGNIESRTEVNAGDFFRQLHKYLILQEAEGLLNMMLDNCQKLVEKDKSTSQKLSHQLRLMANLALFLRYDRQINQGNAKTLNDPVNYIVAFYVNRLILEGVYDIVPKYALYLPDPLREECYLNLLRTFRNPTDTQQRAIIEAAQCEEIDIYGYLTKFVYESIYKGDQMLTTNTSEIREDDLQKIDALKWLLVRSGLQLLGLQYVNSALRSAVLNRRLQMAQKLIALVSADDIRELTNLSADENKDGNLNRSDMPTIRRGELRSQTSRGSIYGLKEAVDLDSYSESDRSEKVDSIHRNKALKEYFCFQAYIEAHHSFTEWLEHFHNNKPQMAHVDNVGLSEAKRQLTEEFAKKALEAKLETWQVSLNGLCDRTCAHLYNILNYQDGGFLQDCYNEEVACERSDQSVLNRERMRIEELRALRKLCVPERNSTSL